MAAIASTDVTYTLQSRSIGESGYKKFVQKVDFGNGVLTYPAGGIPLDAAKLGCPSDLRTLEIFAPASANGFLYKYDFAAKTVRIYQSPAVAGLAALTELSGAATPAATTLYVEANGW